MDYKEEREDEELEEIEESEALDTWIDFLMYPIGMLAGALLAVLLNFILG